MSYIIITGASRGIGRATAERFAAAGWAVATASRSEARLVEMRAHWRDRFPQSPLLALPADLSTGRGRESFLTTVARHWPRVDILVNNIGAYQPATLLDAPDYLPSLLELNLLAAYACCRTFLPGMRKQGYGHVVTVGSVATRDFPVPAGQYSVSKYALEGLHRALEAELRGSGLRTTLLVPGATHTASWAEEEVSGEALLSPETIAAVIWRSCTQAGKVWTREIVIRP